MTSYLYEKIKHEEESLLFRTYGRYPIAIDHGKGNRLWDIDGKEYIDLLTGIAVTTLGHANEEIAQTIASQAKKLLHVSNLFYQREQLDLAHHILATAHFDKVFFCNSGAEANEAAIKLARRYHQRVKNTDAYEVITFQGCFHGRTLATVAATGQARFQDGFYPMPDGFTQIPYGDLDALEKAITTKTAAVMLESIQGEGGIRVAPKEFMEGIARICKEKEILFIADEVQAGMGRTGKWWGFQHYAVKPNIMTTAKALANGIPMGAMLATDEVAQGFVVGSHATTFGAGAFVSAVASKVFEIIKRDKLLERAEEMGTWAIERFQKIAQKYPNTIESIRGRGLMIGIALAVPGKPVWDELINRGIIVNLTQEKVLRLLPALIVNKDDIESFATTLEEILASL